MAEAPDEMTQEYLQRAADAAGEVLEHFIITGLPKLTPEQEVDGALVHPVMKAEGHAGLLCLVVEQAAVEMHRVRVELEEADDGDPAFN